ENVSALYYSEPNEPDHFKAYSVLHPTTGDGPVTALYVFGDALLVFYEHSVWVWRGLDPESDVTWHKIPTGVGTVSPYSIALTPNSLTFLGRSGLYAISPAALGYDVTIQPGDGLVTNLAGNRVEKLIREMADPTKASAIFDAHNQRYMLAYTDENGVRNNRILVFDWSVGGFTEYTGLSCNDLLCRLNGDVLGAINQYIIKFGEGYRDFDDQPIRMVARTKQYNLDYPFHKKNLLNLYCSSGSLGWARRKARCACTWTTSCGPRFWSPHCTPTSCGVSASGGTFGVFATPSPPAPAFSARAIGCRWRFATSSWKIGRASGRDS